MLTFTFPIHVFPYLGYLHVLRSDISKRNLHQFQIFQLTLLVDLYNCINEKDTFVLTINHPKSISLSKKKNWWFEVCFFSRRSQVLHIVLCKNWLTFVFLVVSAGRIFVSVWLMCILRLCFQLTSLKMHPYMGCIHVSHSLFLLSFVLTWLLNCRKETFS